MVLFIVKVGERRGQQPSTEKRRTWGRRKRLKDPKQEAWKAEKGDPSADE